MIVDIEYKEASLAARAHQIEVLENELMEVCNSSRSGHDADLDIPRDGSNTILTELRGAHVKITQNLMNISKTAEELSITNELAIMQKSHYLFSMLCYQINLQCTSIVLTVFD